MEDNFLMTPQSVARPVETMAAESSRSARKELRFDDEESAVSGEELCLPGWGGLDWDDEAVSSHESEREVAEDLLWGLLGTSRVGGCLAGPAPRLSGAVAAAVARVKPVCEQYAWLLGTVEQWALRQTGASLAREGLGWAVDALLQRHRAAVLLLEQRLVQCEWRGGVARVLHASQSMAPLLLLLRRGAEAARGTSAETIQALHELWRSAADPEERAVLSCLLHAAAEAFLTPLSAWIEGGTLRDPRDELCVAGDNGADLRSGAKYFPVCLGGAEAARHLQSCGRHAHALLRLQLEAASEAQLIGRIAAELPLISPLEEKLGEWRPESSAAWRSDVARLSGALGARLLSVVRGEGRLEAQLETLASSCLLQGRGGGWPRELRGARHEALLDASLPRLQQLAELAQPHGLQLVLWPLPLSAHRELLVTPDGHWRDSPAADPASGAPGASGAVTMSVGAALGASWRVPPGLALFLPPAAVRAYGIASRRLLQYDTLAESLSSAWKVLAGRQDSNVPPRSVAAALAACRACGAAVAALQSHFFSCHAPLWSALMREARSGLLLEGLEKAASAHLHAVLTSLFLAVPASRAEAAHVLLDTCEACALFAQRGEEKTDPVAFGAKCQTLLQLLGAAVAALVQQLRSDPASQGLVSDLLALT